VGLRFGLFRLRELILLAPLDLFAANLSAVRAVDFGQMTAVATQS
jgi:hypothetical protein